MCARLQVKFDVQLCKFAAMVGGGRHGEAVALARTCLTPLAEGKPAMEAQVGGSSKPKPKIQFPLTP